ncbi:MAG: 2-amino-4-hydroxy-6-hydroxymethyldihydropteridine diphosphokinase [Lamprobacter sp.]|uniref:2-amino-4-hydroxy-6- hydroxymethyldihydropteridine diphosphokinase n=1 Tax=Lamprobacter sp. TaxID=3100796 RepID=UPI002B25C2BE|nr:2-amino-4-hydroxy-6-hydroxymethyldihydropteridine diphosphokinase [Lamprobacter sp.]MEA3640521.1 2-amino-4-hydroxy-6-hydroxymethyldihydropteridine diphosphokinase [Lamprobacter sp.]
MIESCRNTAVPSVSAYIGLGANLGHPRRQVEQALLQLQSLPQSDVVAVSSLYRTVPVGPVDQPDFINAVARLDTRLKPLALLAALQQIERQHGRIRNGQRWGPRTLDLDILLMGEQVLRLPQLCVPHPQMHCRAFVLGPLAEIAPPGLEIPGQGRVDQQLAALAGEVASMVRLSVDATNGSVSPVDDGVAALMDRHVCACQG